MKQNKYLKAIGLKREDYDYKLWGKLTKRGKQIKKATGLDMRECYDLDYSMIAFMYSRLLFFREHTDKDTIENKFTIDDIEYTFDECVDKICKVFRDYLIEGQSVDFDEFDRAFIFLAKIIPFLWE